MTIHFRPVDRTNQDELAFIAQMDSRIPLDFDPSFIVDENSAPARLKYLQSLAPSDFFEVAVNGPSIIGFHIITVQPYPPDLKIGNIITLWVSPEFRQQGVAGELKRRGEGWARAQKLTFIQTNVHVNNARMQELNQANGYSTAYLHMRKRL